MTYFIGGGRRWKHTCAHTLPNTITSPSRMRTLGVVPPSCLGGNSSNRFTNITVSWGGLLKRSVQTPPPVYVQQWSPRKAGYDVQEKNHPSADHRLSLPLPHTHWATKSATGQGITTWWKIKMSDLICQILSVSPHTLADISPIWSVQIKSKETDWSDTRASGKSAPLRLQVQHKACNSALRGV